MYPSNRIQKKINTYAVVFKALGIINEKEMKKITVKKFNEKL